MSRNEYGGDSLGPVLPIVQLLQNEPSLLGNLQLKRSNTAAEDDCFSAYTLPVVAVNPATNRPGHLYVAYPDAGQNAGDKADIFLLYSTNGGTNWQGPTRINQDAPGTNDQWMPVVAVKPDGSQLFLAWHDRRDDPNNSLIDVLGGVHALGSGCPCVRRFHSFWKRKGSPGLAIAPATTVLPIMARAQPFALLPPALLLQGWRSAGRGPGPLTARQSPAPALPAIEPV